MPKLPLTAVTVIGTITLIAVASLLVFWETYSVARQNTEELTAEKAQHIINGIVERTRSHLDPVKQQIEFLSAVLSTIPAENAEARGRTMASALEATPQLTGLALIEPDGAMLRVVRAHLDAPERVESSVTTLEFRQQFEQSLRAPSAFWGELLYSPDLQVTFINLRSPVSQSGKPSDLLLAGISLQDLSTFLGTQVAKSDLGAGAGLFILYDGQHVLAHPALKTGQYQLGPEKPLPLVSEFSDTVLADILGAGVSDISTAPPQADFGFRRFIHDGEEYVVLTRVITDYGPKPWTIGAYFNRADAAPQLDRLWALPPLFGAVLAIFSLLAFAFGRALTRPIRALSKAAVRVRQLDFTAPAKMNGSWIGEVDRAGSAFRDMSGALRFFGAYVPRSLVRQLMRQHGSQSVPSVEKILTVMFTDIVGFSSRAEGMTATEVAELLNGHFSLLARCVTREGGTIDKYIGDALMAFWGAPDDQPDSAERACRAALAMSRALTEDNAKRRAMGSQPIRIRVGLHRGPAIVGNIGSDERVNYTIVGDTVNLSQRLEALGKSVQVDGVTGDATILASQAVRDHAPLFKWIEAGSFKVAGKSEPVAVYLLAGPQ